MLQSMRSGAKSTPMKIFLIILAAGFAMWGIGDVFRGVASSDDAVIAGDVKISAVEAAIEFDRTRQTFMPNSNNNEAIASGLLDEVLAGLARRSLFTAEARRIGVSVSREMERERVAAETAFQNTLGQFDPARFQMALAQAGISEEELLKQIRFSLNRDQLIDAVASGMKYPQATASAIASWSLEKRRIRFASIKVDEDAVTPPDDAAINSWYGENGSQFNSPLLRSIIVASLSPDDLLDEVELTEDAIAAEYEARIGEFEREEIRDLRQLVFADKATADDARKRLDSGETIAGIGPELLQISAEDTLLEGVSRDSLPDSIAEAVFTADANVIIGPLESMLGFHLLEVTAITPQSISTLEENREELEAGLRRELAVDLVYERIKKLEDAIAGGATISEAAASSGANLQRYDGMDRNGRDIDGGMLDGMAANSQFRQSAWQAEIGTPGFIEDAGDDNFFVLRVDGETPAGPRPLQAVRQRVIDAMITEQAIAAARKTAESLVEAADFDAAANSAGVKIEQSTAFLRNGVGLDHEASRLIAANVFGKQQGERGMVETGTEAIAFSMDSVIAGDDDAIKLEAAGQASLLRASVLRGMEEMMATALAEEHNIRINPQLVQRLLVSVEN